MLKRNLTLDGSVSYIINERNAIVASSDKSGTGIYLLDYQTVEDSFMASNGFIERTILDQKIYTSLQYPPARLVHGNCPALFFSFKTKQFYHVPVYPYVPCSAGACLSYGSFLAGQAAGYSSVIRQMSKVRQGSPVPMESPVYHDEIGDLVDTYNYMTRKIQQLMDEQMKAAEELRIAEFNCLQARIDPHFLVILWMIDGWRFHELNLRDFQRCTKPFPVL